VQEQEPNHDVEYPNASPRFLAGRSDAKDSPIDVDAGFNDLSHQWATILGR
jgi:hypothetical protein